MSHIEQLWQVTLPGGDYFSVKGTPNKDTKRLARRVNSRLKKLGFTTSDVTSVLSCVSMTTGICVRFTYRCQDGVWSMKVLIRCFNNSICPILEWFDDLTYDRTLEITEKYSHEYLW